MNSAVEIANAALLRLGASLVLSLDEDSKAARLARQLYAPVRDAVLRAHPWNCAVKRQALARLETAPSFGFACRHQLPVDCLRLLALAEAGDGEPFRIEGRTLLSNLETASATYVARLEDPAQFDALLGEVIVARLAAELAYPIAGSSALGQTLWQLYEIKLREARGIDAQEGAPPETAGGDRWLRARL